MSAQSNIVAFRGRRRPAGPDTPVNLDTIGKLWALLGQIAALSTYDRLPANTVVNLVRNGARATLDWNELLSLMERLMDCKDDLLACLGDEDRRMLGESVCAFRATYDDWGPLGA